MFLQKIRKENERLQKLEIAKYNEENGTKFKTWDEYRAHLKHIAAMELKFLEMENRKALIQLNIHEEKDEKKMDDEEHMFI